METFVVLNPDGTVAAWGPEVAGTWMTLPEGDPSRYRWDGTAWVELPPPAVDPVALQARLDELQQQVTELSAQIAALTETAP